MDQIAGSSALQPHNWVGQRIPLHATSNGKVLLSALERSEVARQVPALRAYTANTITTLDGADARARRGAPARLRDRDRRARDRAHRSRRAGPQHPRRGDGVAEHLRSDVPARCPPGAADDRGGRGGGPGGVAAAGVAADEQRHPLNARRRAHQQARKSDIVSPGQRCRFVLDGPEADCLPVLRNALALRDTHPIEFPSCGGAVPELFIDGEWRSALTGDTARDPLPRRRATWSAPSTRQAPTTPCGDRGRPARLRQFRLAHVLGPRPQRPAAPGRRPAGRPTRPRSLAPSPSTPASAWSRASTTSTTSSASSATTPCRRGRRRSRRRHRAVRRPQPDRARADRRLRPDHAVELPAAADLLEGRAGAGRRQHVRAQAERADPVDGDPADASTSRRPVCPQASATSSSVPVRRPGLRSRPTPTSTSCRSPAAWRPAES